MSEEGQPLLISPDQLAGGSCVFCGSPVYTIERPLPIQYVCANCKGGLKAENASLRNLLHSLMAVIEEAGEDCLGIGSPMPDHPGYPIAVEVIRDIKAALADPE